MVLVVYYPALVRPPEELLHRKCGTLRGGLDYATPPLSLPGKSSREPRGGPEGFVLQPQKMLIWQMFIVFDRFFNGSSMVFNGFLMVLTRVL